MTRMDANQKPSEDIVRSFYYDDEGYVATCVRGLYSAYKDNKPAPRFPVIPAAKLEAIWNAAARDGFVRNEKALDAIMDHFCQCAARLEVNTSLSGHTEMDSRCWLEYHDINDFDDDEAFDAFVDYAILNDRGGMNISDISDTPIRFILLALGEEDPMQKLAWIDLALSVTHRRSDLASFFVEGGSSTLDRLFSLGTDASVKNGL